jgi:DNA processing protein
VTDADELGAWLRLLLVPGIGRDTARRLLAAFGSPEGVLAAAEDALQTVIGPALATKLRETPADLEQRLSAVRAWLTGGEQRQVLTLGDATYPRALLESPDPPLLLYVLGDVTALSAPAVAIVGSRRPSAQGKDNAHAFAQSLAGAGYVVVSGLALGVDGAAHEGALAAGGRTVAVVGTGLDRVYPKRHLDLARRIAAHGALVSEFLPGTPPLPEHFPQRNRIIAGLSQGTVVVEAALQSGSLITARLANEAGREVFAIPGSIHAEQSRGCHALIRDGARLVESANEIIEDLRQPGLPGLGKPSQELPPVVEAPPPDALLDALGHDPMTLDSLQARTGWPTSELLARLLDLELDGELARLPGGLFQRRVQA